MLEIIIYQDRRSIEMRGHCNYAPHGQDIVCASISSLYLTLLACTDSREIEYNNTRTAQLIGNNPDDDVIMGAVIEGMKRVAMAYPNHVKIVG